MFKFLASLKRTPPPPFPKDDIWLPDHHGEDYLTVLGHLHNLLDPATYFEIGTQTGASLALASCAVIAIDPQFGLDPTCLNNKSECHLYRMTSDAYFAAHSPSKTFGRPIDFAFLDGLHLAEFLLRDFINTEAHCRPGSIIALHDCLPLDAVMARRDQDDRSRPDQPDHPYWWTGDVWLMAEALKIWRPDLKINALDATPTGLLLVSNLNPASTILKDNCAEIIAGFDPGSNPRARYLAYVTSLAIQSTASLQHLGIHRPHP